MLSLLLLTAIAPADLVIEDARIWSDGRTGFARFAAVSRGKFVYVGDPNPSYIGPKTVRLDVDGLVVIPGLIDSHCHMLSGGLNLSQLQLRDVKSKAEFVKRVEDRAKTLPAGKWLLGGRWTVESWAVQEQPTKDWIDAVTGDRPVYLSRMDGHSALVNSAALALARIGKNTHAPEGGVIDRDAQGNPTGILRETAMSLVSRHIPPVSLQDKVAALKKAMAHANSMGITAVSDIGPISDLGVYALAKDSLSVRFSLYPTADDWEGASKLAKEFNSSWAPLIPKAGEPEVRVRGFKAYFDGSLGSRTAYMREPFLGNPPDKPDWRGLPMPIAMNGTFKRNAMAAQKSGFQTIAHAIGDEANNILLNQLFQTYPNLKTARNRSEHAQHLLPGDIARFGRLGVIASMQPYHKADDGRYAEGYIGEARSRSSFAFKWLLDEGAVLAFGSDWPVVSSNPFLGMEAAVTGRILPNAQYPTPNTRTWQTQENLTVADALRAYTSGGAYAMFMENQIGRIAPGLLADFVVLDRSPFDRYAEWSEMKPVAVYVGGRKVFGK